ncbi:hypothetical protein FN976_14225 [Caenimonas sedimenti]|uniref:TerB family tellurite resistance protein n=1 Tax=Caenimonas sedimenti TaxID=2596921 RepID=A0A562ZQT0_9BURK|nr:hypothetical protein [Caenimonas sedimenti]TWO70706.1 hypothetical protein FN976_14225 [Caenimonas sedimenti]
MGEENRDYLELAYRSIQCFSDDGKLLLPELNQLMDIALKDGVVDDNEKRVLRAILRRLVPAELTPEMLARVKELQARHGL